MTPTPEPLLPCPFCGGHEATRQSGLGEYWVMCEDCRATARMCYSKVAADEAWNRRASPSETLTDARLLIGYVRGILLEEGDIDKADRMLCGVLEVLRGDAIPDTVGAMEKAREALHNALLMLHVDHVNTRTQVAEALAILPPAGKDVTK